MKANSSSRLTSCFEVDICGLRIMVAWNAMEDIVGFGYGAIGQNILFLRNVWPRNLKMKGLSQL